MLHRKGGLRQLHILKLLRLLFGAMFFTSLETLKESFAMKTAINLHPLAQKLGPQIAQGVAARGAAGTFVMRAVAE